MKYTTQSYLPINLGTLAMMGFLCILCLIPHDAYAFSFTWENPAEDKSIFYLGLIFGNVSTALAGTAGNSMMGNLFNIFNIAVLTLGSLVVSYTIVLSAINTAQEGEVMGKKWSSMWIPARSAIGVAFLLPTASGYSLLQIMLMNIIVLGIAAANQLWHEIVYASFSNTSTGVFGQVQMDQGAIDDAASTLLGAMVCAQTLNTSPSCQFALNNKVAGAYLNGNDLNIGIQGDPTFGSVCGSMSAHDPAPSQAASSDAWLASNASGFLAAAAGLIGPANEIVAGAPVPGYVDVLPSASNEIKGAITGTPLKEDVSRNNSTKAREAYKYGWIFTGSYYFMIVSQSNNIDWTAFTPSADYSTPSLSQGCTRDLWANGMKMTRYLRTSELSSSSYNQGFQSSSNDDSSGHSKKNPLHKIMKLLEKPITMLIKKIMKSISKGNPDPVKSIQEVGTIILEIAQDLWIGVTIGAFIAMGYACIAAAVQPFCLAGNAVITLLMPLVIAIVALLWAAGVAMGIYTPLIPYLVFTFTALGWMVLVIEAMAAAPIIALGLVSPSQETLGRASGSVQIVTSVFLRPSLMVIGFIAAAKLVRAAVDMINHGFMITMDAAVGFLGIFGSIALIMFYTAIIISAISESFSLIHVIPDKVIRWIGGSAESSGVKEKMGEAKQASQKGAEVGAGMMKGATSWQSEKMAEQNKQFKEDVAKEAKAKAKAAKKKIE